MNATTIGCSVQAAFAAALLAIGLPAQGLPLGDPTLIVSTAVNNNTSPSPVPADPRNSMNYFQYYWDVDANKRVENGNVPTIYGNSAGFWSVNTGTANWYTRMENTADPLALDATSFNEVKSPGGDAYANTGAVARTWYVITGGSGTIDLRVDVAFQGQLAATGADSHAEFTGVVGVLAGQYDNSIERALVLNATNNPGCIPPGGFSQPGTVPNVCLPRDGNRHDINYVIRSNPFTVEFDVPFRLSLSVGTNASTSNGWALSDFSDPGLATSLGFPTVAGLTPEGFILDLDGNWETTDDLAQLSDDEYKYSLNAVVPEPGTLALLGLGLAGLASVRRRKQ